MLIIPAIDLQAGCVVRYVQGIKNKKIYSRQPLAIAGHWVKFGAKFLHIVDLDGAFSGKPKNLNIVKEIARAVPVPVQCGGGLRTIGRIKALLNSPISRVVLGTRAIKDKAFLKKAFAQFGNKVIVSIDDRAGSILTQGWRSSAGAKCTLSFARHLKEMGFKEIIYTDTLKDGTLSGPNIQQIKLLLKKTGLNIIASGGVSSLGDIRRLKKLEKYGLTGVIIGKALYEGKFTLPEALKIS